MFNLEDGLACGGRGLLNGSPARLCSDANNDDVCGVMSVARGIVVKSFTNRCSCFVSSLLSLQECAVLFVVT